jgi:dinuclear metal center YbgI/SA1388 family protein
MADLHKIVEYLERELRTAEIRDYPGAKNGLQLENNGEVNRIISAVDASLAVIEEAAKEGGLLLVHHGMFWQGVQPLTGPFFRKIKAAMDGNLAIYSTHLPLDVHPVFGNNVLLAEAIGLTSIRPALEKNGFPMAVVGDWGRSREELESAVQRAVDRKITVCPSGSAAIGEVAVITGGAGSQVAEVSDLGVGAFVTGEGPHWSYIDAEERGLNVLYAGHYATETFGIRELGKRIGLEFDVETAFIDRFGGL